VIKTTPKLYRHENDTYVLLSGTHVRVRDALDEHSGYGIHRLETSTGIRGRVIVKLLKALYEYKLATIRLMGNTPNESTFSSLSATEVTKIHFDTFNSLTGLARVADKRLVKFDNGHYLLCRPATLSVLLAIKAAPNQPTRIYGDATNMGRTTSMILAWLRDMGFIDQTYAEKKNPGSRAVLSSLRHSFEEIPLDRIAVLNG
jgi:hypothetical protein